MEASRRRGRLAEARLYLVVDARPDVVERALRGGVDIVQLRDKDLDEDRLAEAAREFRELCERADALFLVNDRPDLAAAWSADGVHVGQEDMPVDQARAIVGDDALVGLSTHSLEQIEAASDADYIAVGPVWPTPTKPGRPPVGLELVSLAAERAPVPFFAIGGIDEANVGEVVDAGAERIVVVRAIAEAYDPAAAATALKDALTR